MLASGLSSVSAQHADCPASLPVKGLDFTVQALWKACGRNSCVVKYQRHSRYCKVHLCSLDASIPAFVVCWYLTHPAEHAYTDLREIFPFLYKMQNISLFNPFFHSHNSIASLLYTEYHNVFKQCTT